MHSSNVYVKEVFNVTQKIELMWPSCFYCPTSFQSKLYFNGYQISDSRVAYIIQSGTIALNISNATSKDSGVYEGIFTTCFYIQINFDTFFFFDILTLLGTFRVQIYGMSSDVT